MHPIYDRFQELADKAGVSAYRVGKDTSVKSQTLSSWRKGEYFPKADKIQTLADYFNVPAEYFYSEEPGIFTMSDPQYEVSAGMGRINDESMVELEEMAFPNEFTTVKVVGDSMYPAIHDGDIVKVRYQESTYPNDYTVVKIDGETATIKFVEIVDNGVWLRAINKDVFPDTFYTIQEVMTLPVRVIGRAIEIRRVL